MFSSFPSISPFVFAILATTGVAAWSLLSRKILRGEKDYVATGAVTELLSLAILAAIILIAGSALGNTSFDIASVPPVGWLALVVAFFAYGGAMMTSYKAFQTGEANERAVINQVQNIWIVLLAALLLSEPLTVPVAAGVLLITIGAIVCTYRPDHARWKADGVKLFVISAILFGTGSLADKVAMGYFPVSLYAPVSFCGTAIVALAMLGKQALPRMKKIIGRHGLWMALLAILSVLPYVAFLIALQTLPVSIVGPFLNTNIILTSIGGMILLGEHDHWQQKLAGALMAFAGMWIVGGL